MGQMDHAAVNIHVPVLVWNKFLGTGLLGVILAHVYQTLPDGFMKLLYHSFPPPQD